MLDEIAAVFLKEVRELPRLQGNGRIQLLGFAGVVVYLVWSIPEMLIDPVEAGVIGLGMGTVGAFFLAPQAFAGERERHTLETLLSSPASGAGLVLGKVLAVTALSLTLALGFLAAAVPTMAAIHGSEHVSAMAVAGAAVLSLLGAALAASLGVLISLRSKTVTAAQQRLAILVFATTVPPAAIGVWLLATDRLPEAAIGVLRRIVTAIGGMTPTQLLAAVTFLLLALTGVLLATGIRWLFRREDLTDLL